MIVVEEYFEGLGCMIWIFFGEEGIEVILFFKRGVLGIGDKIVIVVSLCNWFNVNGIGVDVLFFDFICWMFWKGWEVIVVFCLVDEVLFCMMELNFWNGCINCVFFVVFLVRW